MSVHSRNRALERYSLELTKKDEQEIIAMLRNNQFTFVSTSESNIKRKFVYVLYKNIPLKVLYERSNKGGVKQIITIYPFDTEEYNNFLDEKRTQFMAQIEHSIKFLKANGYIVYRRNKKPL